jgi:Protein of unknown function (DUF2384)
MAEVQSTGDTVGGEMASAYADQAIQLREFASVSEHDLAAVTGAGLDAVGAWLDGRAAPTRPQADRLVELAVIVQRLARTMRPDAIPGWLNTPVPVLDGRQPLELIAGGDYERVARVVSSFESPVFT